MSRPLSFLPWAEVPFLSLTPVVRRISEIDCWYDGPVCFGIFHFFLFLIRIRRATNIYLQRHDALETTPWSPSEKTKVVTSNQNWARR